MRRLFLIAFCVAGSLGCDKPAASSTVVQPAATASSAAQVLCIAEAPATDAAIDAELAALKKRVTAVVAGDRLGVDGLVLLGQAWVKKARNSGDPGFYLHAQGCAGQALVLKPQYPPAQNLLALALLNGHRFREAQALAVELLAADKDDIMALGTLSDAALELGDIAASELAAQQMMDLKPSLPSYARASYLRWLRGAQTEALEAIRLAYDAGRGQKDPEPGAWVLTEAAHIFRLRGDLAGSLAGYDKALAEKPDYAPALVGKARDLLARSAQNDVTAATALLTQALALHPLVETAWLLGEAHARAGDKTAADTAFASAKRIGAQTDPRNLALFLATKNLELDSAAAASAEDQRARGGIYGDDVAALVAFRRGDVATAKTLIAKANALGTPDPRLRVHAAIINGDAAALEVAMQHGGSIDVLLAPFAGAP